METDQIRAQRFVAAIPSAGLALAILLRLCEAWPMAAQLGRDVAHISLFAWLIADRLVDAQAWQKRPPLPSPAAVDRRMRD